MLDDAFDQMTLFQVPPAADEKKKAAPPTQDEPPKKPVEVKKSPVAKKRPTPAKKMKKQAPPRGLSGQVPEGDVRLTANIREDLHLKLKIAAARRRTTIGELIEEFVETYL